MNCSAAHRNGKTYFEYIISNDDTFLSTQDTGSHDERCGTTAKKMSLGRKLSELWDMDVGHRNLCSLGIGVLTDWADLGSEIKLIALAGTKSKPAGERVYSDELRK